jgi:hypothetical protein
MSIPMANTGIIQRAQIMVDGVLVRLGMFTANEAAHAAYLAAKRKLHTACTI